MAGRNQPWPDSPAEILMTKNDCVASLATALMSTSHWRTGLDSKWPDHRNARAARLLAKLAGEAANLSDDQFEALRPFVGTEQWGEALKRTARVIGFARRRMSLQYFVRRSKPHRSNRHRETFST
jgi:hypothetical protein